MHTSDLKARLVRFLFLVLCAACLLASPLVGPSYAAQILNGEDPNKIPVIHTDTVNRFVFDYHKIPGFSVNSCKSSFKYFLSINSNDEFM